MNGAEDERRDLARDINDEVKSYDEDAERARLESEYGQVWNTEQLQHDFDVRGFAAPFVGVTRKSDGVGGTLLFQHRPRLYFRFQEVMKN